MLLTKGGEVVIHDVGRRRGLLEDLLVDRCRLVLEWSDVRRVALDSARCDEVGAIAESLLPPPLP